MYIYIYTSETNLKIGQFFGYNLKLINRNGKTSTLQQTNK